MMIQNPFQKNGGETRKPPTGLLNQKWVAMVNFQCQMHASNMSFFPSGFGILSTSSLLSNEKNPGCLGCIGDYTTQLYRDYNKPI